MESYEFTDQQKTEISEDMCNRFGWHTQSGFDENGTPYIYYREGPLTKIQKMMYFPDGTVVRDYGDV